MAEDGYRFSGGGAGGAGSGTSGQGVPTVFNVKDTAYGAKGDGTTNDSTAIQAAINAAAAAGGGTVYLPAGTYKATGLLLKSFVDVRGAGWATILKQPASASSDMFATVDTIQAGCGVASLCIDGSHDLGATGSGITLSGDSSYALTLNGRPFPTDHAHRVRDVLLYRIGANGLNISSRSTQVSGCYGVDFLGLAVNITGSDSHVYDCEFGGMRGHGISVTGSSNRISNVKVFLSGWNVTSSAFVAAASTSKDCFVLGGFWNQMSGCQSQDAGRAGVRILGNNVAGGDGNRVSGHLSGGDRYAGIYLDSAQYCDVDIRFSDADRHNAGQLIYVAGSSFDCQVRYATQPSATTGAVLGTDSGLTKSLDTITIIPSGFGSARAGGYAASLTPDLERADTFAMPLTGNTTINATTFAGPGYKIRFVFKQDATGGRTVTWDSSYHNALPINSAANAVTVVEFVNVQTGAFGNVGTPYWECVRAA